MTCLLRGGAGLQPGSWHRTKRSQRASPASQCRTIRWTGQSARCQHHGQSSPSGLAQAINRTTAEHPPLSGAAHPPALVSRSVTTWYDGVVADHYTLRLAPGVRQRLSEWARRAGIQERTLAQRYVEEGLRHDAHPLVQFLDGPSGRRASLLGRGLDVWEVIATVRDNDGSMAEAAEYLQIPAGLVEAAVAYYGEYRAEIDREIEINETEYERGRAAAAAGEQALHS